MKNKHSVFLLLMLFLSCGRDEKKELKQLLDNTFQENISQANIIVITEYDCEECLNSLKQKLQNRDKNSKLLGIFYHGKNVYKKEYTNFMKYSSEQVNWQMTQDVQLAHLIAKISKEGIGPYFIEIANMKIVSIGKI